MPVLAASAPRVVEVRCVHGTYPAVCGAVVEASVRSLHDQTDQTHYGAGPLGPLGPFAGTLRDFKLEVGVALDAVELARRAAAPGL